ncbi:MAG: sulfurtransferase TusA family protein [Acidimicrobiia bacterium]
MTSKLEQIQVTETIDCSDLLCPLPVYQVALAFEHLATGDVLEVIATDPGSLEDIPALARQRGDAVLATETRGLRHHFWLEKGGSR